MICMSTKICRHIYITKKAIYIYVIKIYIMKSMHILSTQPDLALKLNMSIQPTHRWRNRVLPFPLPVTNNPLPNTQTHQSAISILTSNSLDYFWCFLFLGLLLDINGTIVYVVLCVWLFPLNIVFVRFIHMCSFHSFSLLYGIHLIWIFLWKTHKRL